MKKILKLIYSSNEWYDDLADGKRELFFVLVIMGTLAVAQILMYCYDIWYGVPIWAGVFLLWRMPYMLRPKKKIYYDIETGGLFNNKHFDHEFITKRAEKNKKK
jgi:hypothetical protein